MRRAVGAVVRKDLLVELRTGEVAPAMLLFSISTFVLFHFALDRRSVDGDLAAGVLWVTLLFAAVLGIVRLFVAEREQGGFDGFLLAPVDRTALFVAKATVLFCFLAAVELVAVPAFIGLFNVRVELPLLLLGLLLGTLGLAGVGTLFAAIAAHTRARDVLLPLLLFPIQVPVILATVKTTGAAIRVPGTEPPDVGQWLGLLVAFDALFLSLSIVLFEYAIEEG